MQIPKPILDKIEWDSRIDEPEKFRIKSLAPHIDPCEHCGKTVSDRKIIVKQHISPFLHWRTKCHTCKMVKNPLTGDFDVTDRGANQFYRVNQQKLTKNN